MFFNLLAPENSGSSAAPAGGSWMPMIMLGGLIILMIVFMIFRRRSDKKKYDEIQNMYDAVKPGCKVKTIGGICGIVVSVDKEDHTFILETGSEEMGKSYMKFDREAVYQTDAVAPKADATKVSEQPAEQVEEENAEEKKVEDEKVEEPKEEPKEVKAEE